MNTKPELKVTVFSDYICPFCYVGYHRLMRLNDRYDLKIHWCFIEIHPENSALGEPTTSLDYPSEQWDKLMAGLKRVAREENIPIAEHDFTTNSKDAILLSEATKSLGKGTFYRLHEQIFSNFFVKGNNIGDRSVLKSIASDCDIDADFVDTAWLDDMLKKTISNNFNHARKFEVKSVPSFVFGERVLTGVVEEATMRSAAKELLDIATS